MKNFLIKLKTPSVWFSCLFALLAIGIITVTIVTVIIGITAFWVYFLYGISALLLTYLVYIVVYFAPKIKKQCMKSLLKNKYTQIYIENFGVRSLVSASIGCVINISFAVTQGVLAIITQSVWYGALAIYYISLSLIRGGIIMKHNKRKAFKNDNDYLISQVKSYLNCGIYVTALTLALGGAIAQMVISNQGFKYAGIMIYVVALYTFYKLTLSIINIVKAKKNDDYTIQSIRNLNFITTLVSLLALQTAMFQAFGGDMNPSLANALTGTGVTLSIIAIGIIMIVSGSKKLEQIKKGEENGTEQI